MKRPLKHLQCLVGLVALAPLAVLVNLMPALKEIELPAAAALGVAIEGSTAAWPGTAAAAVLPEFDGFNQSRRYIDVFTPRGPHTLKVWMVEPGVVLQRVLVNTGGLRPSSLGPPESFRVDTIQEPRH